jgi:hypothetical protein
VAISNKVLFRGAVSTTVTDTLYTAPVSASAVITNIVVLNTAALEKTFTLYIGGVLLHKETVIPENSTAYIDLKQALGSSETIQGGASSTDITMHISGVEVTA